MPSTTSDHGHEITYPANGATGWFAVAVAEKQAITDALDNILVTELTTIDDANDNEMMVFSATASAVNHIQIANAATGNGPVISSVGDDTDIDLALTPKGDGNLLLDGLAWPIADGTANYVLKTDGAGTLSWVANGGSTPALDDITDVTITGATAGDIILYNGTAWVDFTVGSDGTLLVADSGQTEGVKWTSTLEDSNGNELLNLATTASAVNHLQITNAATGNGPIISSIGDNTDIDLALTPKGDGNLLLDGLAWPIADGTADYVLKTDGAGTLSWTANTGSGLASVVDDTTPQLGGMLDVNGSGLGDGTRLLLDFVEDASAVNYVQIENQATGGGPIIRPAGTDTDIDLVLEPKGAGNLNLDGLDWPTADGSSGQVLSTNGSGTLSFSTVSTSLDWELISTATASSDATIEFTGIDGTYTTYVIVIEQAAPDTDGVHLWAKWGTGATPTWQASSYNFVRYLADGASITCNASAAGGVVSMTSAGIGNGTNETISGIIEIHNPADTSNFTHSHSKFCYLEDGDGDIALETGSCIWESTTAVTGFQLYFSSGNISTGEFRLYGVKGS